MKEKARPEIMESFLAEFLLQQMEAPEEKLDISEFLVSKKKEVPDLFVAREVPANSASRKEEPAPPPEKRGDEKPEVSVMGLDGQKWAEHKRKLGIK